MAETNNTFAVDDKITTTATTDVNGVHLASFVRNTTYLVMRVNGDNITIGLNGAVTATVKADTCSKVGTSQTTDVKSADKEKEKSDADAEKKSDNAKNSDDSKMTSQGIEDAMTELLYSGNNEEIFKYNMRLYGLPNQFTQYCDYRTYSVSSKPNSQLIGRKFIENIMLEGSVMTVVPGKPMYLPASKNKRGTGYALLSAANGAMSSLVAAATVSNDKNLTEKLRYYDFQPDYYKYMTYVNVLCATAASFLDLNETELDGVPLTRYDWKNYRWNAEKYSTATGNILQGAESSMKGFASTLKTYGEAVFDKVKSVATEGVGGLFSPKEDTTSTDTNTDSKNEKTINDATNSTDNNDKLNADDIDDSILESLEDILTQMNFVQFYINPDISANDQHSNSTGASKLEGMFDGGSDLAKEIAFIANSGGVDAEQMTEYLDHGLDAINSKVLSGGSGGALTNLMSRLMSGASNVIKGENMIFPQIYQNSAYSRSISFSVDLRAPYGNKLSYFINILVPMFHLLALAIPKQTTANTYGSPFLVKCFCPGVISCNLGIVSDLSISKTSQGDGWTVDGYSSQVTVSVTVQDLYSDLAMTPAGDVVLFMSNSSLIEYIATSCGVNLTVPQLVNRAKMMTNLIKQSFTTIADDVAMTVFNNAESLISSFTGV